MLHYLDGDFLHIEDSHQIIYMKFKLTVFLK